jgi:hypothetical protein
MTHAIGCSYADKLAAIAPVSGNIPANCKPARPIPMFLTFGTKDIATPATFMQSASTWAQLDGCSSTPVVTKPYPASNPSSLVTRIDWSGCKNGAEVIADSIHDGPHEWPMNTQTKVNNSEEVWAFFKKFTLGGATALPRREAARPSFSAAYANGLIRLRGLKEGAAVRVLDHQGRLMARSAPGQSEIDFRGKPAGVYHVLAGGSAPAEALELVVP